MHATTNRLLQPLEIGNVRLENNLVLSPMAGYSDLPFRVLCRRYGAGLVCTEMVAATSLGRGALRTLQRMRTTKEERPVSIQLFGTDPEEVARAAREAERGCEILGFNMGCPAWQIQRAGCGAAMLDNPRLAIEMVQSVKSASRKPLLVKIRAGNGNRIDVAAFGRGLESAGADGLIFHARTAAQGYSGRADWSAIRELKRSVAIPVIGNGDVAQGPAAARALSESGCDGIALGRAALGDPRVFHRIRAYLSHGEIVPPPKPAERVEDLREYVHLAADLGLPAPQILAQTQRFTRGMHGAAALRGRLSLQDSPQRLLAIVAAHAETLRAAV